MTSALMLAQEAYDRLLPFASPAAGRNALPLFDALTPLLPDTGTVLEVASGSGFHAAVLAAGTPNLTWQPTEADPQRLPGLEHLVIAASLDNLRKPVSLDATGLSWPVTDVNAVLCLNMIHIAPWSAAQGLLRGAGTYLPDHGVLFLYGPFQVDGTHTAPSNAAFDVSLKRQNPEWGVRDDADVDREAERNGLALESTVPMPANNMIRVYRKER